MAETLVGKWKIVEADEANFEKYLSAAGVGFATRKAVKILRPSVTIAIDNGVWTVVTKSTFKNTTVTYKLNEEQDETTGDGRNVKATYSVEGNKLTKEEVAAPPGVSSRMTREFEQVDGVDAMILTLTTLTDPPVSCRRVYKRDD